MGKYTIGLSGLAQPVFLCPALLRGPKKSTGTSFYGNRRANRRTKCRSMIRMSGFRVINCLGLGIHSFTSTRDATSSAADVVEMRSKQ